MIEQDIKPGILVVSHNAMYLRKLVILSNAYRAHISDSDKECMIEALDLEYLFPVKVTLYSLLTWYEKL
jgi:hypothetical protein